MMEAFYQPTVKTGERLKAEGQAKALKRAGSAWLEDALQRLKDYAADTYVVDDKLELTIDGFRSSGYAVEPPNHNAWGALPRAAVKTGFLKPTTKTMKARRPKAQARVVRVWEINPAEL